MRQRFDPSLLDWEGNLFEIDDGNRAHLFSHGHYGEQDLDDVLEHNGVLLEADPTKGDADWLLIGQPPGEPPLVVPLAPSDYGNVRQARPLSIYPATGEDLKRYRAWREEQR
jgi:hypothetical protein